eukprot:356064-Chlamydomonas_euryale.AAC.13
MDIRMWSGVKLRTAQSRMDRRMGGRHVRAHGWKACAREWRTRVMDQDIRKRGRVQEVEQGIACGCAGSGAGHSLFCAGSGAGHSLWLCRKWSRA